MTKKNFDKTHNDTLLECLSCIFPKITKEEHEKITSYTNYALYSADQIILYEGNDASHLHIICSGKVRVYKIGAKNEEIPLRDIDSINAVGEMANVKEIPFPASIRSIMPTMVAKIDFSKLKKEPFYEPRIIPSLLESISNKLNYHVNINIQFTYSKLPAKAKTACFLIENIDFFNELKRWEVAKILGISPETLSRILNKLAKEGAIHISKRHVEIADHDQLDQAVFEN